MKHIVNFSGGLCSFWAAWRVVREHGPLATVLLFADTLVESPNLYVFNIQCSELLGVPITRVSRELLAEELFALSLLPSRFRSHSETPFLDAGRDREVQSLLCGECKGAETYCAECQEAIEEAGLF